MARLTIVACLLGVMAFAPAGQQRPRGTDAARSAPAPAGRPVIWHDPGNIEHLDFVGGAGGRAGAPKPPFAFEAENLAGSNPKIRVHDANGVKWSVKFGPEVKAETFSTRIAWAAGYFVEADYFIAHGTLDGVGTLTRARRDVDSNGTFHDARFERHREPDIHELADDRSWSWVQNPFVGTQELNGLKIVMMLVSNWDNKDLRDVNRGSNTAILQQPNGDARYLVTDWGATMGKWGGYWSRAKWDCKGYQQQTPMFLRSVKGEAIDWGYAGQHTDDFRADITVRDLRWVARYLARISDDQIRSGLDASGATPDERDCFASSIRARLDRLKACAAPGAESSGACPAR